MEHHSLFKIGNGKRTYFWQSSWLGNSPLKGRFPTIFKISAAPFGSVYDFWDDDTPSWRIKTRRFFKDSEMGYSIDLLAALNMVSISDEEHKRRWDLASSSLFPISSLCKPHSNPSNLSKVLYVAIRKSKNHRKVNILSRILLPREGQYL